jgi:uncharacterized protein (TIGR03435 family)
VAILTTSPWISSRVHGRPGLRCSLVHELEHVRRGENCQIEPASWTHYTFCGKGQIIGEGISVGILAGMLSKELERTVLDQTGLKGPITSRFSGRPIKARLHTWVRFKWPVDGEPGTDSLPPPGSSGPSIFTAIQEQLGLRLESQKEQWEVFVIDHVERPLAN